MGRERREVQTATDLRETRLRADRDGVKRRCNASEELLSLWTDLTDGSSSVKPRLTPLSHQVLRAALLQVVQLAVHLRQVLVDGVQLGLQVLVLLVVAVKLALVVVALLLVGDGRKFAAAENKTKGKFVLQK